MEALSCRDVHLRPSGDDVFSEKGDLLLVEVHAPGMGFDPRNVIVLHADKPAVEFLDVLQ